jgi:hypothetical protein
MRWMAHKNRMEELGYALGEDLLLISYEWFKNHTDKVLKDSRDLLRLHEPLPKPDVRRGALDEWKKQLSPQ